MPLVDASTRDRGCGRRSSSTSRTSRCSGRASGCGSRAAALARGPPVRRRRTSASTRRRSRRSRCRRSRSIGTGKRVGKTAVTGHVARLLARDRDVVVVAMGRGGPAGAGGRRGRADARRPARALARRAATPPPTTSRRPRSPACRRSAAARAAAGSPGGRSTRTCSRARALAAAREPGRRRLRRQRRRDPAGRDRRARPRRRRAGATTSTGYLNPYRVLVSDLVVLTMAATTLAGAIRELEDARVSRRAAPAAASSRSTAGASRSSRPRRGATAVRAHLETARGRPRLAATSPTAPRCATSSSAIDADVFLVELKAAAIDVVAEAAVERGARASCSPPNDVVRSGRATSTTALLALAPEAIARRGAAHERAGATGEPLPLGGEDGLPYSKGLMARALMAAGVSAERAYELARRDRGRPAERGERRDRRSTGSRSSRARCSARSEGERGGPPAAPLQRPARARPADHPPHRRRDRHGKSTVATEVAYRLGITRVTSTDFVRQTMRAFFCAGVHAVDPLLELRGRPRRCRAGAEAGDPCSRGFLDQTRNVLVGVERRDRARARRRAGRSCSRASTSSPGCCRRIDGALVVQCVLAIEDEEAHASHFWVRDAASEGVRAARQVPRRLDDIRLIQDYIVERAREGTACR